MLHQQTLRFRPVYLRGAPLANNSHSVCSLNQVHLRGLVLFPVSLSSLHFAAQVKLAGSKIASATIAVHS